MQKTRVSNWALQSFPYPDLMGRVSPLSPYSAAMWEGSIFLQTESMDCDPKETQSRGCNSHRKHIRFA